MLTLFKLIKDFMIGCRDQTSGENQQQLKGIEEFMDSDDQSITPNEFICPISLQLMQHPVIISSGQTYDQSSIESWMLTGKTTCPVTGQILTNMSMIPNYALRSLITDWCQKNKILPPRGHRTISNPPLTDVEYVNSVAYIEQLNSQDQMVQQKGAANISLFSRRNGQVRAEFGCDGAIPTLTRLMKSTDPVTQGFVMRAILNLSVCDQIKKLMVSAGTINETINVMRTGSLEARELGAAILYSLSVNDEAKRTIGSCGGIELLVDMLGKGSERGQRDATCALFNLCSVLSNTKKAVYFGVIAKLMIYVRNPHSPLIHEALRLLDMIVSSNKDAQKALYAEEPLSHLVTIILTGSLMNQENAVSVLRQLCSRYKKLLEEASRSLVEYYVTDLLECGSDKGRREATKMRNLISALRKRNWAELEPVSESSLKCRSKRIRGQ